MQTTGEQIAISMKNITFRRPASEDPILSDISLDIPTGQWVAIAGENGAGKSTLVRMMNGLLTPSEGSITVEGMTITPESIWDVRKKVAMVFANPDNQFVGMTVADDIVFGMENRCLQQDEMEKRLQQYAEMLGITELLNRHPSYLSGGQKQRVAIASVLALTPSIIIFDEAASMLDETSKREILAVMGRIHKEGRSTIVSVSHDTEELAAADRLIVLGKGGIIADGNPIQLLQSEDILSACRIQMPYTLQVCEALRSQGLDIGVHYNEKELLDALWEYNSKKSPIVTEIQKH